MAIKLIKACKELNIGMSTAVEFCAKMGYPIDTDPNVRIDDDMYMLLTNEFGQNGRQSRRGIQSISVENFRKFAKLESIRLNGTTYIVGGNNAGKSTIVKAIRLVVENLKNLASSGNGYTLRDMTPIFRLDIENVNIGTFEKAHNRKSKEPTITFKSELSGSTSVFLSVHPLGRDTSIAVIPFIRLEDKTVNFAFEVDAKNGKMRLFNISGSTSTADIEEHLQKLNLQLKTVLDELESIQIQLNDSKIILTPAKRMELINKSTRLNSEKEKLEKIIKTTDADLKRRVNTAGTPSGELLYETSLSLKNDTPDDNLLVRFMKGMQVQLSTQNQKSQSQKSKSPVYVMNIDKMIGNFRLDLAASTIEYIGAHAATQKTIFSLDDRNDETVAIIHEWMQQYINPGDEEHRFITDWMRKLLIGVDFKIDSHYGEAYSVNIREHEDDKTTSSMSELGMGAIQMMTLLLHLSSLMRKYKGNNYKPLIIFEEPEQNMHPNWQSHLAEIFEEVRQKGFRIMVETHSEYMIRKSQIQVAALQYADQDDLNDNCPISTYYFPTDEEPYKMEYRTDGKFMNGFRKGFYDEAANLAFDIM